jgi:hypothetical protein
MSRRFLLLQLTCLLWLASPACSKKTEVPAGHRAILSSFEPFPRGEGIPELDRWLAVDLQGKPAGWAHTRVCKHDTPRGPRWVTTSEEFIQVRRGTDKMEARTQERHLENESGQLLRYWQSEQELGGEDVVIQAGRSGPDMITLRGPEVHRVPFEPRAFGTQRSFQILFAKKPPSTGEVRKFRSYDPSRAGYADNRIDMKAVKPGEIEMEHTTTSLPGAVARVKLDAGHTITRIEIGIGALELVYRQVTQKPDLSAGDAAPDIDPLMVIPSNVRIENPRGVSQLRYRIEGLPDYVDSSWLNGPGQKVISHPSPGIFLIEAEMTDDPPPSPFPVKIENPELKKYLFSTSLTRLEDPEITKIAKKVAAKAPDSWTAAKRLRRWVSEEIEGSMGMGFASASQTLKEREGDCSEQSVLLATLARSVGIPARCIMGLVYQDGSFYRHMWTEVWVGRWQPLDPAQATDYLSAAWIRLAVHSLQLTDDQKTGAGGLLLFGAKLKVTVEKLESPKR